MKKYLLAVLLAGVSAGAFAADLPTKKGPPAPPVVYSPPYSWTGFYVGLNGGVGIATLGNSNFAAPTGGLFGGTVGYNYQMGQFVIGGEADLGDAWMRRTSTPMPGATYRISTGLTTTERLRAGIAIDRTLLYLTGGYAGIDTHGSFNYGALSQDTWRNGGAIGGGVEFAVTNNVSLKAEYLYEPYANATYFGGTPAADSNSFVGQCDPRWYQLQVLIGCGTGAPRGPTALPPGLFLLFSLISAFNGSGRASAAAHCLRRWRRAPASILQNLRRRRFRGSASPSDRRADGRFSRRSGTPSIARESQSPVATKRSCRGPRYATFNLLAKF